MGQTPRTLAFIPVRRDALWQKRHNTSVALNDAVCIVSLSFISYTFATSASYPSPFPLPPSLHLLDRQKRKTNTPTILSRSPRMQRANAMSLGMMVARFAWMACGLNCWTDRPGMPPRHLETKTSHVRIETNIQNTTRATCDDAVP